MKVSHLLNWCIDAPVENVQLFDKTICCYDDIDSWGICQMRKEPIKDFDIRDTDEFKEFVKKYADYEVEDFRYIDIYKKVWLEVRKL